MYYTKRVSYNHLASPLQLNNTQLIQLGSLTCKPKGIVRKHVHINWYELTVVTNGEGLIITNDIPKEVKKGDIYLSCPGDFHEIKSSEKAPLEYEFFSFITVNPTIKKRLNKISQNIYDYEKRIFHNNTISGNIKKAIKEYPESKNFRDEILGLIFEETLYEIIRSFDDISITNKDKADSSKETCLKIMHYIDTHIYSIKNLSDLSDTFSYNYSYLSSVFKNTMGFTLLDYYQNRRLDAARLLINEGEFSATAIAGKLNYSSLYSFSKAFKQKYGISPTNYANKLKVEN